MSSDLLRLVGGEEEHFHSWKRGDDLPRGIDAVQDRHVDVDDDHVGLQLAGQLDCFAAVTGFAADLEGGVSP